MINLQTSIENSATPVMTIFTLFSLPVPLVTFSVILVRGSRATFKHPITPGLYPTSPESQRVLKHPLMEWNRTHIKLMFITVGSPNIDSLNLVLSTIKKRTNNGVA